MKVVKIKSEFGLNIAFFENEKYISFNFGGNGDLYWCIHNRYQKIDDVINMIILLLQKKIIWYLDYLKNYFMI